MRDFCGGEKFNDRIVYQAGIYHAAKAAHLHRLLRCFADPESWLMHRPLSIPDADKSSTGLEPSSGILIPRRTL